MLLPQLIEHPRRSRANLAIIRQGATLLLPQQGLPKRGKSPAGPDRLVESAHPVAIATLYQSVISYNLLALKRTTAARGAPGTVWKLVRRHRTSFIERGQLNLRGLSDEP